ncbi:MAG: peptidyl-prolyl cis-trans isomerase [Oscillospiraceae bacterium]|nr:peptidyl-prolyl cis-trans isomerase [Oscillospiraceae bacterium]
MSASRDKKIRKEQIASGMDKKSIAEAEAKKQRRKSSITYSVVAIVIVVLFVFVFIYNSAWPSRHTTAVTIDGTDYTVAQMNYYYSSSYISFYNNYYYYVILGYFFDTSTSLADQEYSDGYTWQDYFMDSAIDTMTEVQLLCNEAEAAGYVMDEDYQAEYEEALESIQTTWESNGYSNLEQYINLVYGKGVTYELVEQELYRTYYASSYAQSLYDGFEYTTDELDEYYTENADSYDVIDYAYYYLSTSSSSDDEEEEDEDAIDPDAVVEAIDGTDLDTFEAYMSENYEAEVTSLSYAGSSLSSTYSEWLLDADREVGDATVIETDSASYIIMFLGRNDNSYYMTDFRHILIEAEDTDGDGEYSDEEIAAAEEEAQAIYDEWLAGDATEDSFAELANEYSTDTGSNTVGGLYEDIYQNEMVDVINDWLFEDGRAAGDTTIVTYSGSSYTGAHIVYYVGASDLTYAQYQADSAMRSADYSAWLEEAESAVTVTTSHLGMCGKNY